jgi:hypothetical protein
MTDRKLRDQLIKQESFSPAMRELYRQGVEAMLENRLSKFQRIAWSLSSLMGLAFFVFFGVVAFKLPPEFPVVGKAVYIAGILFSMAWAVLGFIVVRRGGLNKRMHENTAHGLTFGFTLVLMIGMLLLGQTMPDGILGIKMILGGMVFLLIFGIPSLMLKHMNDAELRIREQMLDLELRIAELAEKQGDAAPVKAVPPSSN